MKNKFLILIIILCFLFVTAYTVNSQNNNEDNISYSDSEFSKVVKELVQDECKCQYEYFEIGKVIDNGDKIYALYFFKTDAENSHLKYVNIKDIAGNIGICGISYGNGKQPKLNEMSAPEFIYKDQKGISFTGIYGKENGVSIIGGKVVQYHFVPMHAGEKVVTADGEEVNVNDVAQVRVELKSGKVINSKVDKYGYFVMKYKTDSNDTKENDDKKDAGSYFNELKSITGFDKDGKITQKIDLGNH